MVSTRPMSFSSAVSYLESLPTPPQWALSTPKRLNEFLGIGLRCQILHVTGTNGKGSACAFASQILRSAGYRVGTYTSPHLSRYNERIAVDGKDISNHDFADAVSQTALAAKRMQETDGVIPSTFEALTAAALLHFQKQSLDFLVLEVGLGGRLDATNAVDAQVALVTNVGLEHTAELGASLSAIAREKSGIIKPGASVATGVSQPAALAEIKAACAKNNASLKTMGKDFSFTLNSVSLSGTRFGYCGAQDYYPALRSSLLGGHQAFNASCAIAAVECFQERGFNVSKKAVYDGVERARWPGRLEIVRRRPLVILDGAHNPHGMAVLRSALKDIVPGKNLVFVVGILADKDYVQMISLLAPLASKMVFCRPDTPRAAGPNVLAVLARKAGCKSVSVVSDVGLAVGEAISSASAKDAVVVCGSLYTVGAARTALCAGV
ncbi:MAG: folylpolyglutamate synthase/dihydrofolate synthase family protein [Candidatus Micrarchaeota archaeon]